MYIFCVQETKWKREKSKGSWWGIYNYIFRKTNTRNGAVRVIVKEVMKEKVVEVIRKCEKVQKEELWQEMNEVMKAIPGRENIVIWDDMNGYVRKDKIS